MTEEDLDIALPSTERSLDTVMSLRVGPGRIDALRRVADSRGAKVSDLLRAAVDWIVVMTDGELDRLLQCRHCAGTGSRLRPKPTEPDP